MADMVQFRSCLASQLSSRPIINGSFILCTDTGALYKDDEDERILVSKAIEFIGTESERTAMLAPENNILYIVLASGKMYVYTDTWNCINRTTEYYYIHNVSIIASGNTVISDSRIKADDTAAFIAYPEVADLATKTVTCKCAAGQVTLTNSNAYILHGLIEITTVE